VAQQCLKQVLQATVQEEGALFLLPLLLFLLLLLLLLLLLFLLLLLWTASLRLNSSNSQLP
jgi:hypothetical protein